MRDPEREAETQAEGEAGSMQGAQCGTQSWDSRIRPWAEGTRSTTEPPRHPHSNFIFFLRFYLFIHERHRKRGRDTGRGRNRLHVGSRTRDLIPGLKDQALGWRQVLNHWATQASQPTLYLIKSLDGKKFKLLVAVGLSRDLVHQY